MSSNLLKITQNKKQKTNPIRQSKQKKLIYENQISLKSVMKESQLCEGTKIIDSHVTQYIETLLRDPLKHILRRQKMLILMQNLIRRNLSKATILYSIANSKVETFRLLFKVGSNQFDLYMKVDTNTNGHRQWFYFSVKNNKKGTIKFNLFRFKKQYSLFQRGMKPYTLSLKAGKQWKPGGFNIFYKYEKANGDILKKDSKTYYLSFQYKFQHPEDEVYFCSGIPYTYTFLQRRLIEFQELSKNSVHFAEGKLKITIEQSAKTLCGLELPSMTIEPDTFREKKYLIINGRTHSGESSSSWVMDGLIEKIMTSHRIHEWMIQNQISFKILPMLNPDGVYLGNYRTGVVGDDFNRKFATGKKQIFPQIHYLKQIITKCKKNGKVLLFLDLHGHSILRNSFLYGPIQSLFASNPLRSLPTTLWHASKYFQLSSCKFSFQKDLVETARVYFQLKENILTYTSQTSLGLYNKNGVTTQMLENNYQSLGGSIVDSMATLVTKVKLEKLTMPLINSQMNSQFKSKTGKNSDIKNSDIKNGQNNKSKKKTSLFFNKSIVNQSSKLGQIEITTNEDRLSQKKDSKDIKKNFKIPKLSKVEANEQINQNQKYQNKYSITEMESKNIKQARISRSICTRNSANKQRNSSVLKEEFSMKKRKSGIESMFKKEKIQKAIQTQQKQQSSEHEVLQIQKAKVNLQKRSKESKQMKVSPQNKFKIRKRADLMKILPESFRKKIGSHGFMHLRSTNHIGEEEEESFTFQRSVTYDSAYLSSQLNELNDQQSMQSMTNILKIEDDSLNLEIIDEQKFSQQYDSINDSDSSSDDLQTKKKQYLLDYIRNNTRIKTNNEQSNLNIEEETSEQINTSISNNINRFKQIQFKSLEPTNKNHQLSRPSKRDPNKFRETTHKSLNRNTNQDSESSMVVQMVQKKQLNERMYRRTQREPYFLVQIKNKHN